MTGATVGAVAGAIIGGPFSPATCAAGAGAGAIVGATGAAVSGAVKGLVLVGTFHYNIAKARARAGHRQYGFSKAIANHNGGGRGEARFDVGHGPLQLMFGAVAGVAGAIAGGDVGEAIFGVTCPMEALKELLFDEAWDHGRGAASGLKQEHVYTAMVASGYPGQAFGAATHAYMFDKVDKATTRNIWKDIKSGRFPKLVFDPYKFRAEIKNDASAVSQWFKKVGKPADEVVQAIKKMSSENFHDCSQVWRQDAQGHDPWPDGDDIGYDVPFATIGRVGDGRNTIVQMGKPQGATPEDYDKYFDKNKIGGSKIGKVFNAIKGLFSRKRK